MLHFFQFRTTGHPLKTQYLEWGSASLPFSLYAQLAQFLHFSCATPAPPISNAMVSIEMVFFMICGFSFSLLMYLITL